MLRASGKGEVQKGGAVRCRKVCACCTTRLGPLSLHEWEKQVTSGHHGSGAQKAGKNW